jgi:hypothetical protein
MTDPIPLKPKKPAANDTLDVEDLWLDTNLGDGITDTRQTTIPIGKPKDFFRVNPDKSYIRRCELYVHKTETSIEEQHYVIAKPMQGRIAEARPASIVTVIDRAGNFRLWPLKLARDGEKDNDAWISARNAARTAMSKWVRIVWEKRQYLIREALDGYAPEPDWSKVPPLNDLIVTAFGVNGVIRNTDHPIYRELFGMPAKAADDVDGEELDIG